MSIKPLNLPSAAGIEYAGGDVRHIALGDELSHLPIGNSTRQLAYRDTLISQKIDELITEVNNKERLVNIPSIRMQLPAGAEEYITNYRIPFGFEARVVNAAVYSSPTGTVLLELLHSTATFGATTGTSVVSTYNEFVGETTFHENGEFIVKLTNTGSSTAEVVASVTLSIRSLLDSDGNLLSTTAVVVSSSQGPKGDIGADGPAGPAGPGGSPGLRWLGTYDGLTNYVANDAVAYTSSGTTSSYISLASQVGVAPTNSATWDVLAQGAQGAPGSSGTAADVSAVSSFIQGTIQTGASFVGGTWSNSDYDSTSLLPNQYRLTSAIRETYMSVDGHGLASLTARIPMAFKGDLYVHLPSVVDNGAITNYTNDNIVLCAVPSGTIPAPAGGGPEADALSISKSGSRRWRVVTTSGTITPTDIIITGLQSF